MQHSDKGRQLRIQLDTKHCTVSPGQIVPEPYPLKRPDIGHFPHTCPQCVHPALVMFNTIDCSWWGCRSYYQR